MDIAEVIKRRDMDDVGGHLYHKQDGIDYCVK